MMTQSLAPRDSPAMQLPDFSLASHPMLARFHRGRSALYGAAAQLLASPPVNGERKRLAAEILVGAAALGDNKIWPAVARDISTQKPQLSLAVAAAWEQLVGELNAPWPESPPRAALLAAAGAPAAAVDAGLAVGGRASAASGLLADLRAMQRLAMLTADMLRAGELLQASQSTALQVAFLNSPTAAALRRVAARGQRAGRPASKRLGRALGWLLVHDGTLLA